MTMFVATLLRRLVLTSTVVLAVGAHSAGAQPAANPTPTPAAIGLAKDLLILKGGQQMFDGMIRNTIDRTKDAFIPSNPSLSRPLNEVAAQLRTEFEPKKNEVFTEVATAYARHFTEAELRELLAFYKTNLGKKVLTAEPVAVEDGFKRAQAWSATFAEQVLARVRAEMKKKGHDL
jgi:uncharacterized protein